MELSKTNQDTIAEWQKGDPIKIHHSVTFATEVWQRRYTLAEYLEIRSSCLCIFPRNSARNQPKEAHEHGNVSSSIMVRNVGLDAGDNEVSGTGYLNSGAISTTAKPTASAQLRQTISGDLSGNDGERIRQGDSERKSGGVRDTVRGFGHGRNWRGELGRLVCLLMRPFAAIRGLLRKAIAG